MSFEVHEGVSGKAKGEWDRLPVFLLQIGRGPYPKEHMARCEHQSQDFQPNFSWETMISYLIPYKASVVCTSVVYTSVVYILIFHQSISLEAFSQKTWN